MRFFLFIFFFTIIGTLVAKKSSSLSDIPNLPLSFPKGTVDQEKKLNKEDKASIDESIAKVYADTNVNIGVVLIQKMNQTGLPTCKGSICAEAFSEGLYSKFSLGHLGVLIFISEDEKQVVIKKGSSLQDLLPEQDISASAKKAGVNIKKVGPATKKYIGIITDMLDAPSTRDKLKARKWGWTTWAVGLSSTFVVVAGVAVSVGTLSGVC